MRSPIGELGHCPAEPQPGHHRQTDPQGKVAVEGGESGLGIRRSLKPLQLPPTTLEYLAPRPRVAYFFEPATVPVADVALEIAA